MEVIFKGGGQRKSLVHDIAEFWSCLVLEGWPAYPGHTERLYATSQDPRQSGSDFRIYYLIIYV